jgi:hypothetical protein
MEAMSSRALNCTNCGAPLTIRSGANALTVVCIQCCSVLDAKDPALGVLQTFQARERIQPKIPLGKRGKLDGCEWEAIGFQERTITVEGIPYSWYEYLLFNPYKGYRYLSEYRGHWNLGRTLRLLPVASTSGRKPAARVGAGTFVHFQTAAARTTYVMGEFPWRVKVGETIECADYIAPPEMLSAETTPEEVVWSMARYTPGAEIWQAFGLPGQAPAAEGVFANQPSPFAGRVRRAWMLFLAFFVGLFALMLLVAMAARNEHVFSGQYHFSPRAGGEASFVTPVFELKGHTSNVELETTTDLRNNWAYFGFALISESTGEAYDFGREVSRYSGSDSDGAWTEGSSKDTAVIPSVPPGRYYLRVEPEMDAAATSVNYSIAVRRDVPSLAWFGLAFLLLFIPPIVVAFRSVRFEGARWAESDYAVASSGDASDSGDD